MISQVSRKIADLLLFTGIYIAVCSVIMVAECYELLMQRPVDFHLAGFTFFATISSYNFYWFLSSHSSLPSLRLTWSLSHRHYHLALATAGILASMFFIFQLREHWFWLCSGAAFSLMYTAPKIPHPLFSWLKKYATGKGILLAIVWVYATVALPVIIEKGGLSEKIILFICGRFFFIYALCILFDYRDREDDKAEGIRSLIISLSEKGVDRLYYFSLAAASVFYLLLANEGFSLSKIIVLLLPVFILLLIHKKAKKDFSDYLYYFILDGLMMLSGLAWLLISLF